jgi:UDP-glucose 4-epimerase
MNILVTGGAEYYIGYSACHALARRYPESRIIIHDNLSKGRSKNISLFLRECLNVTLILWENEDIREYAKLEAVQRQYQPGVVGHLAAIVDSFTINRNGKDV